MLDRYLVVVLHCCNYFHLRCTRNSNAFDTFAAPETMVWTKYQPESALDTSDISKKEMLTPGMVDESFCHT